MPVVKFCLTVAVSLFLAVSPVWANTIAHSGLGPWAAKLTPEKNAFNRIKFLERQLLLSEQIGTAVCLMLADVEAASQSDKARGAADLFATVQLALHSGDENMAVLPESSVPMREALNQIDDVFVIFRAATLQLVNNDLHTVPVSQIMQLDDDLLDLIHDAVDVVEREYGATGANRSKRAIQSLAREQTLLTQRLVKDLCYIMLDINADAMRKELRTTLKQFNIAQARLRQGGGVGVLRNPPTPALLKKLGAVEVLWDDLQALATPAALNNDVSQDALLKALDLSNKLLFKTKQVARSYGR